MEPSNGWRRRLLLDLFQSGLSRVDGRSCTARALIRRRGESATPSAPVHVAAVGKAASAMLLGAQDALGHRLSRALLITKDGHVAPEAALLSGVEIHESAHPVPDARALAAGERLLRWVDELPPEAEPLLLISGGASSLVEVLEEGVSLEALERINQRALAEGVPIAELNARRARISRLKGGKLAARLNGRRALALFISDVPGDDPAVIGSGLLGPSAEGPDQVTREVVASIADAVDSVCEAAGARGLDVYRADDRFDGDADRLAVRFAHELHMRPEHVCVWGGESVVQLPENAGRGGRNQHLALAVARLIAGQPDLTMLVAGTDGTDGPTEDAGGVVDGDTCARVALARLDVDECLRTASSGPALEAAGDLVHTGPTGTNVGDLVIGFKAAGSDSGLLQRTHGDARSPML